MTASSARADNQLVVILMLSVAGFLPQVVERYWVPALSLATAKAVAHLHNVIIAFEFCESH